jgi:N-acetylmuramoyl-L-alanine amidase
VLTRSATLISSAAFLLLAACTPGAGGGAGTGPSPRPEPGEAAVPPEYVPLTAGLPPIQRVEGPLAIRVVQPGANDARPRVDSTFIYGTVGTGGAALTINGTPVPVAPNGAFIAYMRMPSNGSWVLRASKNGQVADRTISYRPTAPAEADTAARAGNAVYASARAARVTGGADTLATGSDAVYARPTPGGAYRWFFPRGTRLSLAERRGNQYRVQLDPATAAWIDASAVSVADTAAAPAAPVALGAIDVRPAAGWVDVRIPAQRAPFLVEPGEREWTVTLYGVTAQAANAVQRDPMLVGVAQEPAGPSTTRLRLSLARAAWGYKAFYAADGALVVRVRRAPNIDAANPLRGRRIVIDPGHPPAGATGPTGLYEGDANLAISLPLAEKLRAAGAEVIMTRTTREAPFSTNTGEDLRGRTSLAVRSDGDILVSVHNNAFGEAQNPFRAFHTAVYFFQPWSRPLAHDLAQQIAGVTLLPNRGALNGNLALVRPTWLPSALTESLFMPIPEEENALRDPGFLDRLAAAHVRGIEAFFRAQAGK